MIEVIKSSLDNVIGDIKYHVCNLKGEEKIGYLVADRVAVWEPNDTKNNNETYNYSYCYWQDIEVVPIKMQGGAIVNNIGDIGLLVLSPDMYSKWEIAAMDELVAYLDTEYNIKAVREKNDLLINNKKFVGTGHKFMLASNVRLSAMFISMNDDTQWLVNKICTKPGRGCIGLNKFDVCIQSLITHMIKFTNKWAERKL